MSRTKIKTGDLTDGAVTSAKVDSSIAKTADMYSDTDVASYLFGNLDTHILPDTNATYDIGSASYKIRDLYLSDNSLHIGENVLRTASSKLLFNGEDVMDYANITSKPTTLAGYGITDGGGGASGTADFVASGTLPNGAPVVLKADGTVEVVGQSLGDTISVASSSTFSSNTPLNMRVSFDPNDASKFVIVYMPYSSSRHTTAVAGSISGTTISFGTPVALTSYNTEWSALTFDPNNSGKFVVTYRNGSSGEAIVGTLSGTTISFGTAVVFDSGSAIDITAAFDPNNSGKFVVTFRDSTSGKAIVGTVSGTSISFGSSYTFNTGEPYYTSISFDPNTAGKFAIAYRDGGNLDYGTVIVGTVSGTSISFGTKVVFNSSGSNWDSIAFDPNTAGVCVIAWVSGWDGKAIVGTVSGASISFGSSYTFSSQQPEESQCSFDPNNAGRFLLSYRAAQDSHYGKAILGTLSQTVISFGAEVVFDASNSFYTASDFSTESTRKILIVSRGANNTLGSAVVGLIPGGATNLTSTNFLGTSTAAYTDTQTATIMLQGGVSDNQSGLTTGTGYYVQEDGTLATTADIVSVFAGKALSATSLQLDGPEAEPPAASGTADFVATGTLPNGSPVALKSDGTVEAVAETSTPVAQNIPSSSTTDIFANAISAPYIAFDPNTSGRFVAVYKNDWSSYEGELVVGTSTASSITSVSSPVNLTGSGQWSNNFSKPFVAFDPNTPNTFVILYRTYSSGWYGVARVGTISGTSVTLGTPVVVTHQNFVEMNLACDPNTAGKYIAIWSDGTNSKKGNASVLTVSGTSISVATPTIYSTSMTGRQYIDFDPHTSGRFLIGFHSHTNGYVNAVVGTVSGTSLTFGSSAIVNYTSGTWEDVKFDPHTANQFICVGSSGSSIQSNLCTISGTSITVGSQQYHSPTSTATYTRLMFDTHTPNQYALIFRDWGNSSYIEVLVGTISGSSHSLSSSTVIASTTTAYNALALDPTTAGKFMVFYRDVNASGKGVSVLGQLAASTVAANLTTTNFVGTSTAAYTTGQTASIMLQGGLSTNQSGLTVGSTYYVQQDGTLATTADSISVVAGKAISATALLLKGI